MIETSDVARVSLIIYVVESKKQKYKCFSFLAKNFIFLSKKDQNGHRGRDR